MSTLHMLNKCAAKHQFAVNHQFATNYQFTANYQLAANHLMKKTNDTGTGPVPD
jgi:hypothetical protein